MLHVALTHDGTTGWGEAVAMPDVTGEALAGILDALEGADARALDPDDVASSLERLASLPKGARAGLDLALHDLAGRLAGRPVHELLGLPEGAGPTAATVTLTDPAAATEEAQAWFERGFTTLKVKLGGATDRDLDLVQAVRQVLPRELPERVAELSPGTKLWVDANEALSLSAALELIPAFAELGVDLVEQPLPRAELDASAQLARETGTTIFLDEAIQGPEDVARLADLEGPLGVNVKVQKVGGLIPAVACIQAARDQGRPVMVGCNIETGLGIAAGAELCGSVDHADLDGNLFLAHDPFPMPRPRPGWVGTSAGPGLGAVPDPRYLPPPAAP